ncbi:WecB/TagA/CpsF family glycosyltransferase [Candidatus Acetothermia bacterium]|nr:WecB/TagA/CpsF family glycosyltransferase [Candidatus Acetothermia bacterium]MBI3643394.1 WecB/TagA/CpsF family glycosyltransferase [Candidatus Acetothermia bacterium]
MTPTGCVREEASAPSLAMLRRWQPWHSNSARFHLFGAPIDRLTQSEVVARAEGWIEERRFGRLICTLDTTALMRARWDINLGEAYQKADVVAADGIGLVWASRLLGCAISERVTGIDLMERLFCNAESYGHRVFLLGAAPGVIEKAKERLEQRYPKLQVSGTHHGYFGSDDEKDLIAKINMAKPDLLFVGMGVPLQETWLIKNREKLEVPVLMGVGGSFDVLAGLVRRAPMLWQNRGLEWLWRAICQPERLWRIRVIPLFLLQILFYKCASWTLNSV